MLVEYKCDDSILFNVGLNFVRFPEPRVPAQPRPCALAAQPKVAEARENRLGRSSGEPAFICQLCQDRAGYGEILKTHGNILTQLKALRAAHHDINKVPVARRSKDFFKKKESAFISFLGGTDTSQVLPS